MPLELVHHAAQHPLAADGGWRDHEPPRAEAAALGAKNRCLAWAYWQGEATNAMNWPMLKDTPANLFATVCATTTMPTIALRMSRMAA